MSPQGHLHSQKNKRKNTFLVSHVLSRDEAVVRLEHWVFTRSPNNEHYGTFARNLSAPAKCAIINSETVNALQDR